MFKKKKVRENKVNLNEINVDDGEEEQEKDDTVPKLPISKKINKFSTDKNKEEKASSTREPLRVRYGLIDKEEVNSKYHANQELEQPKIQ